MTETTSEGTPGYSPNRLPKGVSQDQLRRVLAAAEIAYKTKPAGQLLPSIDDVARLAGTHKNVVAKVVTSAEGKEALLKRGIRWTTNINLAGILTPEQIFAISIITDPTNRRTFGDKLKQAGISHTQYKAWLKNPTFASKVSEIGESLLNDNISTVHARLVQRADQGDINAIKLFYEVSGRHDPSQKQMLDIVKIVGLILEVITRYVNDVEVLKKVSTDIDTILNGGVPRGLQDPPANYISPIVDAEVIEDGSSRMDSSSVHSDFGAGDFRPVPVGTHPRLNAVPSTTRVTSEVDGSVVVPFGFFDPLPEELE